MRSSFFYEISIEQNKSSPTHQKGPIEAESRGVQLTSYYQHVLLVNILVSSMIILLDTPPIWPRVLNSDRNAKFFHFHSLKQKTLSLGILYAFNYLQQQQTLFFSPGGCRLRIEQHNLAVDQLLRLECIFCEITLYDIFNCSLRGQQHFVS